MDRLRRVLKVKLHIVHELKKSRGKFSMQVIIGNRDDLCTLHTLNEGYHPFLSHLPGFLVMNGFDKLIPFNVLG